MNTAPDICNATDDPMNPPETEDDSHPTDHDDIPSEQDLQQEEEVEIEAEKNQNDVTQKPIYCPTDCDSGYDSHPTDNDDISSEQSLCDSPQTKSKQYIDTLCTSQEEEVEEIEAEQTKRDSNQTPSGDCMDCPSDLYSKCSQLYNKTCKFNEAQYNNQGERVDNLYIHKQIEEGFERFTTMIAILSSSFEEKFNTMNRKIDNNMNHKMNQSDLMNQKMDAMLNKMGQKMDTILNTMNERRDSIVNNSFTSFVSYTPPQQYRRLSFSEIGDASNDFNLDIHPFDEEIIDDVQSSPSPEFEHLPLCLHRSLSDPCSSLSSLSSFSLLSSSSLSPIIAASHHAMTPKKKQFCFDVAKTSMSPYKSNKVKKVTDKKESQKSQSRRQSNQSGSKQSDSPNNDNNNHNSVGFSQESSGNGGDKDEGNNDKNNNNKKQPSNEFKQDNSKRTTKQNDDETKQAENKDDDMEITIMTRLEMKKSKSAPNPSTMKLNSKQSPLRPTDISSPSPTINLVGTTEKIIDESDVDMDIPSIPTDEIMTHNGDINVATADTPIPTTEDDGNNDKYNNQETEQDQHHDTAQEQYIPIIPLRQSQSAPTPSTTKLNPNATAFTPSSTHCTHEHRAHKRARSASPTLRIFPMMTSIPSDTEIEIEIDIPTPETPTCHGAGAPTDDTMTDNGGKYVDSPDPLPSITLGDAGLTPQHLELQVVDTETPLMPTPETSQFYESMASTDQTIEDNGANTVWTPQPFDMEYVDTDTSTLKTPLFYKSAAPTDESMTDNGDNNVATPDPPPSSTPKTPPFHESTAPTDESIKDSRYKPSLSAGFGSEVIDIKTPKRTKGGKKKKSKKNKRKNKKHQKLEKAKLMTGYTSKGVDGAEGNIERHPEFLQCIQDQVQQAFVNVNHVLDSYTAIANIEGEMASLDNGNTKIYNFGFREKQTNKKLLCLAAKSEKYNYQYGFDKLMSVGAICNEYEVKEQDLSESIPSILKTRFPNKAMHEFKIKEVIMDETKFEKLITRKSTKFHEDDIVRIYYKEDNNRSNDLLMSKEQFLSDLRAINRTQVHLVPILMFKGTKFWLEFVWIVKIDKNQTNTSIGISFKYDEKTKNVIITGIHCNKEQLMSQRELVMFLDEEKKCDCLDRFESNIDRLKIYCNPDEKYYKPRYKNLHQFISSFVNADAKDFEFEDFCKYGKKILNQPDKQHQVMLSH